MSGDDPGDDSTYRGPSIPGPLGEGLRTALGLDERPSRFGDYVDAMARFVDRAGLAVDLDTLCTTDESPHRALFCGTVQHYHCTLDAIIVPFIEAAVDRVVVETASPVSGSRIEYTVTEAEIVPDPASAVLSFGVGTDLNPPAEPDPALAYRRVCPYGKAFVSLDEYERWAAEVDAHTMPITMADGLALARALGEMT